MLRSRACKVGGCLPAAVVGRHPRTSPPLTLGRPQALGDSRGSPSRSLSICLNQDRLGGYQLGDYVAALSPRFDAGNQLEGCPWSR